MMASVADNNETLVSSGERFGRLLDTIAIAVEARGYQVARVLVPFSPPTSTSKKLWGDPLSYNRKYFIACLRDAMSLAESKRSHREKFFDSLLDATRPKVVFTIGGPTALRVVCERRSVPCVEVAHGGGDIGQLISEHKALPSHIITFDPQPSFPVHLTGRTVVMECEPFWEQAVARSRDDHWSNMPTLVEPPRASDSLPNVLYTTSWFGQIPRAVLLAIKTGRQTSRWFIRMHPVLNGPGPLAYLLRHLLRLKILPFRNVEIERSSSCPLPLLLKNITHHITFSSATCFEAARQGIPSLVLSPRASSAWLSDLRREGYVTFGAASFTVTDWISSSKELPPRLKNKFGKPLDFHLDLLGL